MIINTIAKELTINVKQVEAVIKLLEEGATVPFIARYRKEATGGLTDTQLRSFVERFEYLQELEDRRATILKTIESQQKLTPELKASILAADNKTRLEDLYLPYKPKRRTKAQIAKEAGLEPLALALLHNPLLDPNTEAEKYIDSEKNITEVQQALDGARSILVELFSEDADLLELLRQQLWKHAAIFSQLSKGKEKEGVKFSDYFEFSESISKIPSHRLLALFRGRKEKVLFLNIKFVEQNNEEYCLNKIANHFKIQMKARPADHWLMQTVEWAWKIKLQIKLELELMMALKERADEEAINVFKDNLKNLLMTAPAGNRVVMGLDPGLRTGVKVVVIDGTGKLLIHTTIFPHAPRNDWDQSIEVLAKLCQKFNIELISIGNGTASRETDRLVADTIKRYSTLNITKIVVSEAGASVYSASELAALEFPDLDVSFRGAVSIARRLQDPLAELVKIDPKSIGVGQYQHDVNQVKLGKGLSAVVEDCVNAVGTDVNTASAPLLTSISGLNEAIAKNIVEFRNQHGRFKNRNELKKVPRLGQKTFEQAAGFLRIVNGSNPLDASAVHPESYPLVDQILHVLKKQVNEVMGNESLLNSVDPKKFISENVGLPTIKDILKELNKPGRDPRPEFQVAHFKEGVEHINDLTPGMKLEGVITNVANFGAFVDIGVHQDGLVHVSEIANHYVTDIQKEVKVGQIVKVTVLEVDLNRKRISLSMKTDAQSSKPQSQSHSKEKASSKKMKQNKKGTKDNNKSLDDKAPSLLAEKLKRALE